MPTPPHPKVRPCTHIKPNGVRCGSPAMKNQYFCFFHTDLIKGVPRRVDARISPMAMLENADAIQLSLMGTMQDLLSQSIDYKHASLMVKLLHLAFRNVKNLTFEKASTKRNAVTDMPNYAAQFLAEHPEYGPPLESRPEKEKFFDIKPKQTDTQPAPCIAPPAENPVPPVQNAPPDSPLATSAPPGSPTHAPCPAELVPGAKEPSLLLSIEAAIPTKSATTIEAAKPRKIAARRASRGNKPHRNQPRSGERKASSDYKRELREIRRVQRALPGFLKGNWKDVKTAFEFAGIFPAKKPANGRGG
jgi:hypothetical protein